jgi:UDP-glucose 4-epimerase
MKYLITGGGGFIGSSLAERLDREKYETVVVGNLANSMMMKTNAKLYDIDIGSERMHDIIEKERPDIIIHLAGPINLRKKVNDANFAKSCSFFSDFKYILDYSKNIGIKKVIVVSSGGAIYADSKGVPIPESYFASPSSLYGMANLMLEKLLMEYNRTFGIGFVVLRLSNVYGPKQWRAGETKSFVVPSFIEKILGKEVLNISGDGKQTRDFVFIDDVTEALLIAAETKKMEIFNIGSGQEISLNDLFAKIEKIVNIKARPLYDDLAEIGAERSALDISKAKKELNWKPAVSLDEGLARTINWYRSKYGEK